MRIPVILLLFVMLAGNPEPLVSQTNTGAEKDLRMEWWRDARFGMFIHWGLYAIPAGEWNGKTNYGEWIRTSAQIPLTEYDKFQGQFNPVQFDADAWVKMARDAGMKYIVITSKHHDGFCMFDTKQTGFNILETPFKRDPMKELGAACRKYGVKLCFYYSIMDWHHPDYLPRRDWEKDRTAEGAEYDRYVAYMKAQLKELLTSYGDIGVLWFDGEWESTWNEKYGREIYNYVRSLQPGILVNNRVGAGRLDMEGMTKKGMFGGDFGTPEQQIPATGLPGVDWETCMTMNDHWGYNKSDKDFKSSAEIIRMLADIASKGGNYLLNVGPTAQGTFPPESIERLKSIGAWMRVNGEAIYGTKASPFTDTAWGRCTMKETKSGALLYLHVFHWPKDGVLKVRGILNEPVKAWLLADSKKKKLPVERKDDALILSLPATAPDTVNSVVVLEIKGIPDIIAPPRIESDFPIFSDSLRVDIKADREDVQIRFTLDQTEPTITSPLFVDALKLKMTAYVSARCFRDGKPVSGTTMKMFRRVFPYAAKAVDLPVAGLQYQYFEGDWDSLPPFKKLKPVKEGVIADFLLTPKEREERFAFVFSGYVQVPATTTYAFYTESDDGSRLYIDDRMIVDNDGLHGAQEKSGTVALVKGFHKIRVEYFEQTGSDQLKVYYRTQGATKKALPATWLYYNRK